MKEQGIPETIKQAAELFYATLTVAQIDEIRNQDDSWIPSFDVIEWATMNCALWEIGSPISLDAAKYGLRLCEVPSVMFDFIESKSNGGRFDILESCAKKMDFWSSYDPEATPASLYDIECGDMRRPILFFKNQISVSDNSGKIKFHTETNLNQSSKLDYPREFKVDGFAASIQVSNFKSLDLGQIKINIYGLGEEISIKFSDFPTCKFDYLRRMVSTTKLTSGGWEVEDNQVLDRYLAKRMIKNRISPHQPFYAKLDWGNQSKRHNAKAAFAISGTIYAPRRTGSKSDLYKEQK